jgi:hypothetical protein
VQRRSPTRSGYVITPVALWAGTAPELVPNPDEVAAVYRVPVAQIDVEPRFVTIPESDAPVIRLPLFGRFVHARRRRCCTSSARSCCTAGRPGVAHLEQPVFAWR